MKMKSKLLVVTVMLVVSILMMSTASFAWFTISTAPEVKGMTTTVVTNENLEVALAGNTNAMPAASAIGDTGLMTKWGNLIDLASSTDTATTQAYEDLNKVLRPAKLNEGVFQYPTYGADGRPDTFANLTLDETLPFGYLSATDAEGNKEVYGYYMDVWFRSNVGGTVTLSDVADRSAEGVEGEGSFIITDNRFLADNIRIAVQVLAKGTTAYDGTTSVTPVTGGAITEMTTAQSTAEAAEYTNKFTGDVVTLTANEAQLVRIFVYLDGAKITNEAASIDGSIVDAELNLQFAITGVDKSMDGQSQIAP